MKESKISKRFEEISAELRDMDETKALLRHLGGLREAVRELQDDGLRLTLEGRPGAYKCPLEFGPDTRALANGTVRLEGIEMDFAITRKNGGSMCFNAYIGKHDILGKYLSMGDGSDSELRVNVIDALLRINARRRMLGEFNIDEKGHTGVSIDNDISIVRPLKLKNTPPQP